MLTRSGGGERVAVPGSERRPILGARDLGPALHRVEVEVTLWLRRASEANQTPLASPGATGPLAGRRYLPREEFARVHGARGADLDLVREFASRSSLEVRASSVPRRTVELVGSVNDLGAAFGTELRRFAYPGGTYRGRSGPITLPRAVAQAVEGVFGLDDRPQARPHVRRRRAGAVGPGYSPLTVGAAYGFPSGTGGAGQTIGLLELGGGYSSDDLATYFAGLGLATPTVTSVSVDGGNNAPTGGAGGPDDEVELDVEVAGALAPGARVVVYFAPNTDRGFLDALTSAAHDETNHPTVISVSWGGPEPSWTDQARAALDSAAEDASSLGISVLAASGDQGASDGEASGQLAVDFPASSPHVLACGGTRLTLRAGGIGSERVWNDLSVGEGATGGGVSATFARPTFQGTANVPLSPSGSAGRGVPDVAGDADPETGYAVRVDGSDVVLGGTSAVAPLWAALLARVNGALGTTLGLAAPLLYGPRAAATFHDITVGSNGFYSAGPGWDPCTGLGSPNGSTLLAALRVPG
jgi:kumamolisin